MYMKCIWFVDIKTVWKCANHCRFQSLSTQINGLKFGSFVTFDGVGKTTQCLRSVKVTKWILFTCFIYIVAIAFPAFRRSKYTPTAYYYFILVIICGDWTWLIQLLPMLRYSACRTHFPSHDWVIEYNILVYYI